MKNKTLLSGLVISSQLVGVSMSANINYSEGPAGGGAWETGANWNNTASPGSPPGTGDTARPAWGTTPDSHTVSLNSEVSVQGLQNGVNRQGTVEIGAGGILTSTNDGTYNSVAWNDNDASFVNLLGGGIWNITSTARLAIGRQGNGVGSTLNIYSGSTLNMSGGGDLEFNDGALAEATALEYFATIHDGGSATVGRLQFNMGHGRLDIRNGGSVTITTDQTSYVNDRVADGNIISSDGALSVGAWDGSSMTISAVPEPSTSTLFGVLGATALLIRRRTS